MEYFGGSCLRLGLNGLRQSKKDKQTKRVSLVGLSCGADGLRPITPQQHKPTEPHLSSFLPFHFRKEEEIAFHRLVCSWVKRN